MTNFKINTYDSELIDLGRQDFLEVDWRDMEQAEQDGYIMLVKRVQQEDETINVYELYQHPEVRAKLWRDFTHIVADRIGLTLTAKTLLDTVATLDRHFWNIVDKLIDKASRADYDKFVEWADGADDKKSFSEMAILRGII